MAALRWSVIRPLLDELRPHRVLEVGCGQGSFGARIAQRSSYVGVEMDAQSSVTARQRVEPVGGQVLHGTTDLLDEGDQFDLVCAFEVAEHIDDDAGAVQTWTERTAPGGTVVVSVPAWPERFGPTDEHVGHFRRYRPEQLDTLLSGAGLLEVRHVLYGWPLGFVLEAVRDQITSRRAPAAHATMADRTAGSGRFFQPRGAVGIAVRAGTAPFIAMQKARPSSGVGLVGIGRRVAP